MTTAERQKQALEPLFDSPHFAALALPSECLAVPSDTGVLQQLPTGASLMWPAIGIPPLVYQRRRGSTPRWVSWVDYYFFGSKQVQCRPQLSNSALMASRSLC